MKEQREVEVQADVYFAMVPEWVLDAGFTPSAVVVYLTLARYANRRSRTCYPSKETIQAKCGLSHGTVSRALAELKQGGAISTHRRNLEGRPTSNVYILHMAGPFGVVGPEALIPNLEALIPKFGTQTRQENQTREESKNILSDDFDQFWNVYPRRIAKGLARKAWTKATKATEPQVIIDAAKQFADRRQGEDNQFTPHPATWLNGERWLDQPEPKSFANNRDKENNLVKEAIKRLTQQQGELEQ